MSFKTQLTDDMKQAMRDRNSLKLGVIRFLLSEIKNFEIDHGEQDDASLLKLVAKQVKQMKDAVAEFAKGGREDLVAEETQKIAILETYLPAQMSDADLAAVVQKVVAALPEGERNMGPIMQQVKAQVGDQADGGRVAAAVKSAL